MCNDFDDNDDDRTSLEEGFHTPHSNLVTGLITFHCDIGDDDYNDDDDLIQR